MHHKIAKMVSRLQNEELPQEKFEEINKVFREDFEVELLKNEAETIEFLEKNRLEIEAHWCAIIEHFNSEAIYQATRIY